MDGCWLLVCVFWVSHWEVSIRPRGLICKCWALQLKTVECCGFSVLSVCVSTTKANTVREELKISWSWLSKSVSDYDLDLFFILSVGLFYTSFFIIRWILVCEVLRYIAEALQKCSWGKKLYGDLSSMVSQLWLYVLQWKGNELLHGCSLSK